MGVLRGGTLLFPPDHGRARRAQLQLGGSVVAAPGGRGGFGVSFAAGAARRGRRVSRGIQFRPDWSRHVRVPFFIRSLHGPTESNRLFASLIRKIIGRLL